METKKIVMNGYCRECGNVNVAISVTPQSNVNDVQCSKCGHKWNTVDIVVISKEDLDRLRH